MTSWRRWRRARRSDDRAAVTTEPAAVDPRRNPVVLSWAVGEEIARVERLSVRVGIALVAGGAIILALLGSALPALRFVTTLAWWLPPALLTLTAAILVASMPLVALPRRVVDAWIALAWFAATGRKGWLERGGRFPEAHEVDAWLAAHPGPEEALRRAEVLIGHGRIAEAEVPEESEVAPEERFLRAQMAWSVAFARGDDASATVARARLGELLDEMPAGPARAGASAAIRLTDALRDYVWGGDWIAPLVDARRDLGSLADGLLLRHFVAPRLVFYGRISLGVFLVALLVNVVLGGA